MTARALPLDSGSELQHRGTGEISDRVTSFTQVTSHRNHDFEGIPAGVVEQRSEVAAF